MDPKPFPISAMFLTDRPGFLAPPGGEESVRPAPATPAPGMATRYVTGEGYPSERQVAPSMFGAAPRWPTCEKVT